MQTRYPKKFKLFLATLEVIILFFAGCRTPEIYLRDNKIEPVVEKTYKINSQILNNVLSKSVHSIDDLFALALDRSEKIAISSEDMYQSREKIKAAWGAIMPQLSFRMGIYTPDSGVSSGSFFSNGFRFYARQTIITGLDEITAIKAGKLQEGYTYEVFQAQASVIYEQISQVFFQYLINLESLKTERLLLENTIDLKTELEKRFRLGKIRRSELLNTEVLIAKTEAKIASIEDLLRNTEIEIRNLTGLEKTFTPENPDLEEHPDLIKYREHSFLYQRPDISSLRIQWEISRQETIRTVGGHVPKIYLEGSYRLPSDSSSQGDYYAGLVAEVPLFSGGQTHSLYLAAKSKERQAKLRYDEALRVAEVTFNYYLESYESGKEILKMQKIAYDKAVNNYLVILADYRIGQATNLEVLSALNDRASAGQEYEKTRLMHELNLVRIRILAGELPLRNSGVK